MNFGRRHLNVYSMNILQKLKNLFEMPLSVRNRTSQDFNFITSSSWKERENMEVQCMSIKMLSAIPLSDKLVHECVG